MRNIAAALRNPALAMEYLGWRLHGLAGPVTFGLRNGARIGNFVSFSEYHSIRGCISKVEQDFFLSRTPNDNSPIIDVGANIGTVSALLGWEFSGRAIHAFEPAPTTFAALQRNMVMNGLDHVTCHRMALSDQPGTVEFDADPNQRATARMFTEATRHVLTVPATTLDAFTEAKGISSIGLLKIDVEGFEALVFRGAGRVLAERMPRVIFMEVCPALTRSAGFGTAEPARIVEAAGYRWHRLEETGALTPVTLADIEGIVLENWVALPE